MKIDRKMWESVRAWKELAVWGGMIESSTGEVVCSQFVYWVFSEGVHFLSEGERLEWIIVENLVVTKAIVSKNGRLYQASIDT